MRYVRRAIESKLLELSGGFGAILVTGPRQAGKTSLCLRVMEEQFGGQEERLRAFDTPRDLDAFRRDPDAFFAERDAPIFIDEVQHAPDVFPYLKREIDAARDKRFRFLLSGSQHFHLMKGITESLAGRAAVLDLWPFARQELTGAAPEETIEFLEVPARLASLEGEDFPCGGEEAVLAAMLRGGYPPVALERVSPGDWLEAYRRTFVQRDIRDLSQVGDLGRFDRFVTFCAARSATLVNKSELGRLLGIDHKTVDRWLSLLETSYQLVSIPAWAGSTGKRLVRRAKPVFADIGLSLHLQAIHDEASLRAAPHYGALFESFVLMEIRKLYGHAGRLWQGHHWRTARGGECDLVLPVAGRAVGVEIKCTARPSLVDLRGVQEFRAAHGERASSGLLITIAPRVERLGDGCWHLPLGLLLRGR